MLIVANTVSVGDILWNVVILANEVRVHKGKHTKATITNIENQGNYKQYHLKCNQRKVNNQQSERTRSDKKNYRSKDIWDEKSMHLQLMGKDLFAEEKNVIGDLGHAILLLPYIYT